MKTAVLMSIKPAYADAILLRRKRYEFRRTVFRSPPVRRVLIYASNPVQRVVGEFAVVGVLRMELDALWLLTMDGAGLDRESFDAYFAGRNQGNAIEVGRVIRYQLPFRLRDLGVQRPPQSFCYVAV